MFSIPISMSAYARTSPHRGLVSAPDGRNIAPGTDPASGPVKEDFRNFRQQFFDADFCCRQTTASCTFVRQRSSLCRAGAAPKSRPFFKLYMDTDRELTDITDRKPRTPGYKYSFRLNEEQNIRFNELLCKAGLEHNRNRFSNFG